MPQYVYLKLGYDADKTTKEDAIAMLKYGDFYPRLLSLEEIKWMSEKEKSKETELNIKERTELSGLLKDMEEMKEAVEELISERRENKDEAKILNARIEKITDTNPFRETLSLIVNRSGKRYLLEAKAAKDQFGVCRPWINVEELE